MEDKKDIQEEIVNEENVEVENPAVDDTKVDPKQEEPKEKKGFFGKKEDTEKKKLQEHDSLNFWLSKMIKIDLFEGVF